MSNQIPDDIVCQARVLQRIGQEIGVCEFKDGSESIGVVITAHWIDTFNILIVKWDWSGSIDPDIIKILNGWNLTPQFSPSYCDNLSQAGREAVFQIDKKIVGIDKTVSGLNALKRSHQWEELVRNCIR